MLRLMVGFMYYRFYYEICSISGQHNLPGDILQEPRKCFQKTSNSSGICNRVFSEICGQVAAPYKITGNY